MGVEVVLEPQRVVFTLLGCDLSDMDIAVLCGQPPAASDTVCCPWRCGGAEGMVVILYRFCCLA